MTEMTNIAIFGGTFDPIHNGHLNLAHEMMEKHHLDEIWFCPVRYSPHKIGVQVSSVEDRMKMVQLAIQGNEAFKAVDFEIKRDGPSYTIDTLRELHKQFPGVHFSLIIGDDSAKGFFKWRDPEKIVELARLLVGSRSPEGFLELPLDGHPAVVKALRDGLTRTPIIDVSATDIRARARQGKSLESLLPQKVIDYIRINRLYCSSN